MNLPDDARDLIPKVSEASKNALRELYLKAGADPALLEPEIDRLIKIAADVTFDIVYFADDKTFSKKLLRHARGARSKAGGVVKELQAMAKLDSIMAEGSVNGPRVEVSRTIVELERLQHALSAMIDEYRPPAAPASKKKKGGRHKKNQALRLVLSAGRLYVQLCGKPPPYSKSSTPKLLEALRDVANDMYPAQLVMDEFSPQTYKRARDICAGG